jgi:DNA-binding HxlR family transcriptional regulator
MAYQAHNDSKAASIFEARSVYHFDFRSASGVANMARPKPGTPVRGSQTGRPIMALLDLLGRRWTLRIIWELREGPVSFLDLQQRCDSMSTSTLSLRLSELRKAGIVAQDNENRYKLSEEGVNLFHSLNPLNKWAERWAEREKKMAAISDEKS